jgi:hypothetical protein
MTRITKTLNPLPFDHLEPHRFEDMVRQLVYDFREWRTLEATGRSGSDDGFDARGWEVVTNWVINETQEDNHEDADEPMREEDRVWLIQCKRERTIGPAKIEKYLKEIESEKNQLHGIIFAAACDFSKATRDKFRAMCRAYSFKEAYLWGKGELEDLLFQPKNDNLLFAYFGISLIIRRRSQKTQLNAILSMKRKAVRCFGEVRSQLNPVPVLLRDPEEKRYPFAQSIEDFDVFPRWRIYKIHSFAPNGLYFSLACHPAFFDEDTMHFDYVGDVNTATVHRDPWHEVEDTADDFNRKRNVLGYHNAIPENNRAWLYLLGLIEFENIVAIDEIGDVFTEYPHIYVHFRKSEHPPFSEIIGQIRMDRNYSRSMFILYFCKFALTRPCV